MLLAIACLTILGTTIGLALGIASSRLSVEESPLVREIEALMPGSQCGQCGFAGCSQAASAIAEKKANVTACPPGGQHLARKIAALMGVVLEPGQGEELRKVAQVEEALCIGCTKCYRVCPTDAIVGAPKQIHAVLSEYCTACGLCVDACPTETIQLGHIAESLDEWRWPKPEPRAA